MASETSTDEDYYALLGVARDATLKEIKRAYRVAVRKHHPDLGRDSADPELFKRIQEAYRVLGNPLTRGEYDAFRSRAGVVKDFVIDTAASLEAQLEDFCINPAAAADPLFDDDPRKKAQLDIICTLELTAAQFTAGGTFEVAVERPVQCTDCAGTGAAGPDAISPCDICGGKGVVAHERNGNGFSIGNRGPRLRQCWKCAGDGELITDPCPQCHGQGYIEKTEMVAVTVAPETAPKTSLRVEGEGLTPAMLAMLRHAPLPEPTLDVPTEQGALVVIIRQAQ